MPLLAQLTRLVRRPPNLKPPRHVYRPGVTDAHRWAKQYVPTVKNGGTR